MIEIQGTIQEVIFHNKDNGYTVAKALCEGEDLTVVGTLLACGKGRTYNFKGDFTVHPLYGEQFSLKESQEVLPASESAISSFLSSGILKGIGPKAAASIVEVFGKETLKIIENSPEKLTKVSGIGPKKAASIAEAFKSHRQLAEITMYLQNFDISPSYAMKLYKEYGADTLEVLEENPYRLATEMTGIGFRKADLIAEKLGIQKTDENRIESGITYTLLHFVNEGHTFVPRKVLLEKTVELLDIGEEEIDNKLVDMAFEGSIRVENLEDRDVVFLMAYYLAEQAVTKGLVDLSNAEIKPIDSQVDSLISLTEREISITFSQEQRFAVTSSLREGVTVITGGPGTGKTTIINGILTVFEHNNFVTAIAAPTGRAAKRISETSGRPASTIHRLLEYQYMDGEDSMRFGRNQENPLDCDVLIIDEASMIDLMLMKAVVNAIKPGTRLVLVGDGDQLPSVGAGNILSDILASEYIHSVCLKEIFRQAGESLIVVNAHTINRGEYPFFNEKDKDFFFLRRNGEKEMAQTILDLCASRLPTSYPDFDPMQDIQVLTPVHRGIVGTIELNKSLQQVLNPPSEDKEEKKYGEKVFRQGDKVMQIRNNYTLRWKRGGDFLEGEGVFNGDLGFIHSIDTEFDEMTVIFDDNKYVKYGFGDLDQLEMAYAVTVHKAQGSEFPVVVMPISWFPPMLATRNLLYTAVTRGKELVILVGSQNKMEAMIDNNRIMDRYSGLKARLAAMIN